MKAIHYGYVIVLCCCLIMGVNVGLVMSCAGIFFLAVSGGIGLYALSVRKKIVKTLK